MRRQCVVNCCLLFIAAREEQENEESGEDEEEERGEDPKESFEKSRRKTASPSMLKMMLEMSDSDDESEEVEKAISRGQAKAEKIIDVEAFLQQTGSARKNPSPSTKLYQQIKSTPLRSCISAKKKKKRTTAKKSVVFGSPNAAEFDTLDPVKGGMTPLHKHVAKQMFRMDGHEAMTTEEDTETALNSTILATWEEEETFAEASEGQDAKHENSGQSRRSSERRQSNIGILYKNRPSLVPDSDDDRANLQGQFDEMAASPIQESSDDPNRTVELSTLKNLVADESMDDIDNSDIMQTEDHTVELGSLNDLIGNSPLIRTSSTKKKAPPSPHTAELRVMSFERKRRPQTPASLASNTVELGNLSELAADPDDENRTAEPGVVSAMLRETPQSVRSSLAEQTVALGDLQELVNGGGNEDMSEAGDEAQHTVELGQLSELTRSSEQRKHSGSRVSSKRKLSSSERELSSGRSKKSRETPQSKSGNVALHLSFSTMSTGSHSTHKDSFLANNAIENFLDTPSTQASSMSEHVKTPEVLARLKDKESESCSRSNSRAQVEAVRPSDQSQIAQGRSPSPLHSNSRPRNLGSALSKRLSVSSRGSRRSSIQRKEARVSIESQPPSVQKQRTPSPSTSPSPKQATSIRSVVATAKEQTASQSASPSAMTSYSRSPSPIASHMSSSPLLNGASQETEVVNVSPVAGPASSSSPLLVSRSPVRESSDDGTKQASMRETFHQRLNDLRAKLIAIQELMSRYNEFYNMSVTISEQLSVITSFEEKGKELKSEEAVLENEIASVREESCALVDAHRKEQNAKSQGLKLVQSRCLALELCPKLSLYQLKNISANAIVFALANTDYELRVRLAPGETTPRIVKFEFHPTGKKLLGRKRKHCAPQVENGYEESLSAVVNATLEDTGKKLIGSAAADLHKLLPRLNQSTLRVMNMWEEIAVLCMSRPLTFEVDGVSLVLKFDIVDIPKEVFVKTSISIRVDKYPCGFGACQPKFEVMAGKDEPGLVRRLERVTASQSTKLQPLTRQCAQIEQVIRNH